MHNFAPTAYEIVIFAIRCLVVTLSAALTGLLFRHRLRSRRRMTPAQRHGNILMLVAVVYLTLFTAVVLANNATPVFPGSLAVLGNLLLLLALGYALVPGHEDPL